MNHKILRRSVVIKSRYTLLFCAIACAAVSASAQSFCDLVPAATVQSMLGIKETLIATPDTSGGNGCNYKPAGGGPTSVVADSISDAGIYKTIFDNRLKSMGPGEERVPGVGDAAYFSLRQHEQLPKFSNMNVTLESIVFRAKGKIVNFDLTVPGLGVPKSAMVALADYTIAKPIGSLKDPQ